MTKVKGQSDTERFEKKKWRCRSVLISDPCSHLNSVKIYICVFSIRFILCVFLCSLSWIVFVDRSSVLVFVKPLWQELNKQSKFTSLLWRQCRAELRSDWLQVNPPIMPRWVDFPFGTGPWGVEWLMAQRSEVRRLRPQRIAPFTLHSVWGSVMRSTHKNLTCVCHENNDTIEDIFIQLNKTKRPSHQKYCRVHYRGV